jgi:phosphoglycerate dehydrogenase-like enzyme
MLNALTILNPDNFNTVFGPSEQADLASRLRLLAPPMGPAEARSRPDLLAQMDILLSSWGGPKLDEAFLQASPRLQLVLYAAGSIRGLVTPEFWARRIPICSAWAANAIPVTEFTLSQILFSLKHGWKYVFAVKRLGAYPPREPVPRANHTTVGLVSLGMIGRQVAERLKTFDLRVLAYDPFVGEDDARRLGVTLRPLDDLFRESDVVSLHTPWLKETERMIRGAHFRAMKPGATFINTARGAIVDEAEMIEVLQQRPDIFAVLDVTYPEPPRPGSPLYSLPNVVLTPHIAGSMSGECRRMARFMIEELDRYLAGEPLRWQVTEEMACRMA